MKPRITTLSEIVHSTRSGVLGIGLALALTAAAAPSAVAETDLDFCDPYEFVGEVVWELVPHLTVVGDQGRIAVVVEDVLYDSVWSIETFVFGLAEDGYSVVVARFSGPAYDPAEPKGLRNRLQALYAEEDSLVGAVLVGDLPHVCYELVTPVGEDVVDEAWPADTFFMDMDGVWTDEYAAGYWDADKFDHWYDPDEQVEIWVSRIVGHNLPLIGVSEASIINDYFERNRSLRGDALRASHPALVADGRDHPPGCCRKDVGTLARAFGAVDNICEADVIAQEYIARLGLEPPDNYYYVHELSHGGGACHTFHLGEPGEEVCSEDYLAADPYVLGYSLISCLVCNFTQTDFLGGIVAFNPAADALVVHGYSALHFTAAEPTAALWREVGVGRSYGDGQKAEFNRVFGANSLRMVLLGDGSLKAPAVNWDGGGYYDNWSDPLNWDIDDWPGQYDPVRISAATVQVDPSPPYDHVWAVDLRDGANLTFPAGNALYLTSSLLAKAADPPSAITLNPGSRLDVERGDLANVTVDMPDSVYETTILNVAGAMENCGSVQVGANCNVMGIDNIGACTFDLVAGLVEANRVSASNFVVVGQNGQVTAPDGIHDSVFSSVLGSVSTSTIGNSDFVVGPSGTVTAGAGIQRCGFVVGQNASVSTGWIDQCGFVVGPGGSVAATDGITGLAGIEDQDWEVTDGVVSAGGESILWGNWTVSGGPTTALPSVTFHRMSANPEYGITLQLMNEANVELTEIPHDTPTFPGTYGLVHPEHKLAYGGYGLNRFGGGCPDGNCEIMFFGDYTRISAVDPAGELELDLHCKLYIVSDFMHDVVSSEWDSDRVDLIVQPIDNEYPQYIELISPDLTAWYRTRPVAFEDVACQGAFRDLTLEAPTPEIPDPVPVFASNWWNNSITDEGPRPAWPTIDRDVAGTAEAGCFHNVTVKPGRTLDFAEIAGVIYYTGIRDIQEGATIRYWPEDGSGPEVLDPQEYDTVIVPAQLTLYGDWNGDCIITNAELAELQDVIRGTYDPLMDYDCDGELTNVVELPAFLANMAQQPECGRGMLGGEGGGGEFGEDWPLMEGEPMFDWPLFDEWVPYEDVPDLAAWVAEQLSPEELAAIVEALTAAAVEFADTPVGYDIAELLFHLQ